MSGVLMDKAIQELGGKQWVLTALETPAFGLMERPEPISVSEFVSDSCRPCAKSIKSMNVLFDVHVHIPQCGNPAELVQELAANVDNIPPPINFKAALPQNSKVDFIFVTKENGRGQGHLLASSCLFSGGQLLVQGWCFRTCSPCRSLEHQERCAVAPQSSWWSSTSVAYSAGKTTATSENGSKTTWSPSNAEIEEGILYNNAQAPECDAQMSKPCGSSSTSSLTLALRSPVDPVGLSQRCWENSFCYHSGHGSWKISRSPVWGSRVDLKSFLTSDEDGTVESRYNDTRLIRNQLRAYASNDLKEEDWHYSACRTLLDKEAIIHRICLEDLHKDLLADKDKPQYGKYKAGVLETGPAFDADVQREQP
eukprot:s526_g41.t1